MLQSNDDSRGWFKKQQCFKFFFFLNRKICLFSLTASRLSGIVCIAIFNIFARNTHKKNYFFFVFVTCLLDSFCVCLQSCRCCINSMFS